MGVKARRLGAIIVQKYDNAPLPPVLRSQRGLVRARAATTRGSQSRSLSNAEHCVHTRSVVYTSTRHARTRAAPAKEE